MEAPKQGQKGSFYKGLLTFYLIFLAIFFAAAPFLTLLLYAEADLSLSLLPQLIGFCLQGAFLVVVFSIYEKRSSLNSKRSHKFALRTFLSSFVTPCLEHGHSDDELISSPAHFAEGLDRLRGQGIEKRTVATLQKVAQQNVTSLESLTVLAAQIDHTHLEAWSTILQKSREIRDASDPKQSKEAIIQMLESILKFDELIIY
ncbi:MAG: hypothetical protein HQL72_10160 [Magnetococcales bacterium]|nr:hypothetical protein [Magnetococcales bacterium]